MLCPTCGPHGQVEQIGFSPEYETFFCRVCQQEYVAFPTGNGELSELVPHNERTKHHKAHGTMDDSDKL